MSSWKERLARQAPVEEPVDGDVAVVEPPSAAVPVGIATADLVELAPVVAKDVAAELARDRPLAPQVRARLDRANDRRTSLKAEIAGLALDAQLGDHGAVERQRKLQSALVKSAVEVETLEAALVEAEARDSTMENAATVAAMKAGLAELEGVCAARAKAAADMDAAVGAAVGAWLRLRASTELIRMSIPRGCSLPRGFVDLDLRRLVAGALWKHSNVASPGQEAHAFPGACAPNFSTQYNATAIENVAEAVDAQNAFVSGSIKRQIGETEKFYAGELGEAVCV
jgi:hypothetical protein